MMTAESACVQRTLEANPLREPVFLSAIQSLHLPQGSRGLDVGCGPGLQAVLLADAVGPYGHVTGIDIEPEVLAYGKEYARANGCSDRITFKEGDVRDLPFESGAFDWAWSADCIGYPHGELLPVLKELMRVLRPGGRIFLLGWTTQQLLPGYPILEAWLNAACSAYLPFFQGKKPELNFLRAKRWFREAGLEQVRVSTFVGEAQSPLRQGERAALLSLFEMLWSNPVTAEALSEGGSLQDWKDYQSLCDPASPDFILDLPEYYAFFTYTLFQGTIPVG